MMSYPKSSGSRSRGGSNFWWWEPSSESVPFEFCRDTSLHGLKYIYQPQRHLTERIFWFFTFLVGLTVAVYLIHNAWNSYQNNNLIVTFEPVETPVGEIPFPAVTICNMNKVQKNKAQQILAKLHTPDYEALDELTQAQNNISLLHHVCNVSSGFSKTFNFSLHKGAVSDEDMREFVVNTNETHTGQADIEKFLQFASQKCSDMLPICIWQDQTQSCMELFNPIETDFGKCCTFNMVSQTLLNTFRSYDDRDDPEVVRQWSNWDIGKDGLLIRDDYDENGTFRKYPRRQKRSGKTFGLSILLDPDLGEYFCTTSDSVGFRLTTHLSIDSPHVADYGIAIPPNAEVYVNLNAEITMAEDNIRSYSLDKRNCYFPQEHDLTYYNYYTSSNCINECIAEQTFQSCDCVRYYMPRDDNQTLCGPDKFACAEQIKSNTIQNFQLEGLRSSCAHCLRTCTDIQYFMDTTQTNILNAEDNWQFENGSFARWRHNNVSIVHIYFGSPSTYARSRKELNGPVSFMASTGGIMGLCLGFSVLSLIEFVYYFTFRVWCERKWSRLFSVKVFDTAVTAWKDTSIFGGKQNNLKNYNGLNTSATPLPLVSASYSNRGGKVNDLVRQNHLHDSSFPVIVPVGNEDSRLTNTPNTPGMNHNVDKTVVVHEIAPYYSQLERTQYWNVVE
ncbi:unnamed protein product [Allacma fusca]|uniref:Pickpocket protein 28 n=1 Tax=Allacma fusca TaxID=39272 RepID=A0A8J2KEL1_9HEXA|nr:unnamed protein product [Allacma fusca]